MFNADMIEGTDKGHDCFRTRGPRFNAVYHSLIVTLEQYSLAWPPVSPCVACDDNSKELFKFNRELKLLSGPGHTQPLSGTIGTVSYGSSGICLQLHVKSWGPLIEEEEGLPEYIERA